MRRHRYESARAQAMVEFALVLPLLLVIVVGTLDFGRAIFAHNSVSNAARSATRVAIVDQTVSVIEDAARREAVGLHPITVVISYTDGGVACSPVRRGCIARVEVRHDWMPATPIVNALAGPVTLESSASMPVEHVSPAP